MVTIEQKPLYNNLPVGQQVIFAVSENTIVATKYKVKFVAEVHVSHAAINLGNNNALIGTFKTTPNNEGVGIFDFRPVLETFVNPDYLGSTKGNGSRYKLSAVPHPIHLIDRFSRNDNTVRFFAIKFKVEYADDPTGDVGAPTNDKHSQEYVMFNGVLQNDDTLTLGEINVSGSLVSGNNYGYNLDATNFYPLPSLMKFLTNAPTTQYARLTDYGAMGFLNFLPSATDRVRSFDITYYWDGGSSTQNIWQGWTAGGQWGFFAKTEILLMYFGCFPANLQNWSSAFATAVTNGLTHYTIQAKDEYSAIGQLYTINIICDNQRGYEGIRLTWLNQWGTWDYYTFNMKSTKSIKTKRISYTQQEGTWNESTFKINGYKGGKKNFKVNSTERIKLNTGFVTEAEGVWFEELINSNEVYIVNGFSTDEYRTITNKYIEPVTLRTSSYTRKTIANDKNMQYTIEIEKSKMKRTQAV